jgi:hypothetical protein
MMQGTYHAKGDRWVERSLSLRETCRLRAIPTLPVLVHAVTCSFNGQPPDVSWIERICPPEHRLWPPVCVYASLTSTVRAGQASIEGIIQTHRFFPSWYSFDSSLPATA